MAHSEQQQFCESVRALFPDMFKNKTVLDVGSLDINGNKRYLFTDCLYTGLDIGPGPNVDVVSPVHLFKPPFKYDVVICCEMLEHDRYWRESLKAMYKLLKPGGLLVLTAASLDRQPHGVETRHPEASPFTNDYYMNINKIHIFEVFKYKLNRYFKDWKISLNYDSNDIYMYGIKEKQSIFNTLFK